MADVIHQLLATEDALDKRVVQATIEPTTWLLITGWGATAVERKLIENL